MSKLKVSKEVQNEGVMLSAQFYGDDVPSSVFLYENTGTDELGDYVGVVFADKLNHYQVWEAKSIPIFGNKYLRHDRAKILVPHDRDSDSVVKDLVDSVSQLARGLRQTSSSTQVFDNI